MAELCNPPDNNTIENNEPEMDDDEVVI